jgi:hypothetical protein
MKAARYGGVVTAVCLWGVLACPSGGPAWAAGPVWQSDQPLTIDPGASQTTFNFARNIATDEAGQVHVVWYDTRTGQAPQPYSRSRTDAWYETRVGQTHIYYRRSPDQGVSWGPEQRLSSAQAINEHPSIAVSGGRVYVVWHAYTPEQGASVCFTYSSNRGATWAPPKPLAGPHSVHPSIAVVGSTLHLIWVDTRSGEEEVYYRRSADGGQTWEAERPLTEAPMPSWTPSIAASEAIVAVAWVDTHDGNEEEYIKVSADAGQTWSKDTRITKDRLSSEAPSIAVSGRTIHLVWFDQKANGVDFQDAERQLDDIMRLIGLSYTTESLKKPPASLFDADALQVRVQQKLLQVRAAAPLWKARGGDPLQFDAMLQEIDRIVKTASRDWDIYYRRSDDGGQKWQKEVQLTKAAGASVRPTVALSGAAIHVVWSDNRDGNMALYYRASTDNGRSWSPETRLTDGPGDAERPSVAASASSLHLLWFDTRSGNPEIYYRRMIEDK